MRRRSVGPITIEPEAAHRIRHPQPRLRQPEIERVENAPEKNAPAVCQP